MKWLGGLKTYRAAVLGCGPAGLFATHALVENGWEVTVFSKRRKSDLFGAQYLHGTIPGLTPNGEDPVLIKYLLTGTADGYREKVYGTGNPNVGVSVEVMGREHQAWDIRTTYDVAWERYQDLVMDTQLSPREVHNLDGMDFKLILSSIPMPALCYREHQFQSAKVWALGDAPRHGQYVPYRPAHNTVECNGERDTGWYRASNVFEHATMEWPGNRKPPLPGVAEVTKPIYTDCNCYRDGTLHTRFIPIGRYGQWSKGVLTHHAYTQAAAL